MLDFVPVREKRMTMDELTAGLSQDDLRRLTDEMIDAQLAMLADCVDADVVFTPQDPQAHDAYAERPEDVGISWTLGHVIVHVTASAEESAFLAAELARGVEFHGRSRYEIPWQAVTTIEQCRSRLEESRRMRLASLDVWPNPPHLDNFYQSAPDRPRYNALGRFVLGLRHDDDHLAQIAEIVRQAKAARG